MKRLVRKISLILLIGIIFYSCNKTSTPKEFLYKSIVYNEDYSEDKAQLEELLSIRFDSIEKNNRVQSHYLGSTVDTIFYGSKNKIAILSVSERTNKYQANSESNTENVVEYIAECYIGFRTSDSIEIIKNLKYKVTSDDSKSAKRKIREIYFREMNFIEGMYNINDIRFWESDVWL